MWHAEETAAEMIRAARIEAGLSIAELARRSGTSRPAISRYEAGRSDPTFGVLRRILRAAGADIRRESDGSDGSDIHPAAPVRRNPRQADISDVASSVHSRRFKEVLDLAAAIKASRDPSLVAVPPEEPPWPIFKELVAARRTRLTRGA